MSGPFAGPGRLGLGAVPSSVPVLLLAVPARGVRPGRRVGWCAPKHRTSPVSGDPHRLGDFESRLLQCEEERRSKERSSRFRASSRRLLDMAPGREGCAAEVEGVWSPSSLIDRRSAPLDGDGAGDIRELRRRSTFSRPLSRSGRAGAAGSRAIRRGNTLAGPSRNPSEKNQRNNGFSRKQQQLQKSFRVGTHQFGKIFKNCKIFQVLVLRQRRMCTIGR